MESGLIEGFAMVALLFERQSDRPELGAPAFQFLLSAGGDVYAPSGEGGFDLWNHRAQVAVETPLAETRKAAASPAVFFHHSIKKSGKVKWVDVKATWD